MSGRAGTVIVGRYELSEPAGEGGMGRVWRGRDKLLGRDVAVKEIPLPPQSPQENAELAARVLREAQAAARLGRPGVVTVQEVVEQDGTLWIIMRLVPGSSLGAEIGLLGRLPWQRLAPIAWQAAEMLARAHGAGLVHGDLKPGNILLTWPPADTVVLTDFGTAQIRAVAARLAGADAPTGTSTYLAPEQLGGGEAGPPSDMWALGAALYTAVEGRPPFTGSTEAELMAAIASEPVALPEFAGPLRDLIAALLAKDPAGRPDAQAAMTALAAPAGLAPANPAVPPSAANAAVPPSAANAAVPPSPANAAVPPSATISPVQGARLAPSPYTVPLPADGLGPAPRRKNALVAAVAVTAAAAVVVALIVVAAVLAPAPKKQGSPPASPGPASSAGGQAAAAVQPALGSALTATGTASLTDSDGFLGIAFSPDGKTLAASAENSAATEGHVDIWDSRGGHRTAVLNGPAAGGDLLNGMAFSPVDANTLAVGDASGVDVWNLAARSSVTYDDPDGAAVEDVAYAPGGATLAECDFSGHVYLLDTATGQWLEQSFIDPAATQAKYLVQVAFSPDGKTLAATDMAGNVYAWRLSGGAPLVIRGAESYEYPTQTIAFSPDSRTLAVALRGGVQLWDVATRKLTARLAGDDTSPDAIAFSPNGIGLAVGDEDGDLYLWNVATRRETVGGTYGGGWAELAFSPDGKTLAAIPTGSPIQLYRISYPAA